MWETVQLGDICEVIAGQSPKGENYNKDEMGLPFYQGKKDYGEIYLKKPTVWTTKVTKKAYPNDILMSVRAPVGALNITNQEICIGRGLAAIRVKEKVDRNFIFYALSNIANDLTGTAGAIFDSINKKQIESIEFDIPSLTEQQRIVAKLDSIFTEIDTAIATTEKKQKEITKLKQTILTNILHPQTPPAKIWKTTKLRDVCTLRNGRAYKKPELLSEGKYCVLRVGNFFTSNRWYYSNLELDDTKYCDNGDLLYAWSASFGARLWEGEKVIYHYHIWRVDIDEKIINKHFLYYWFEFDKELIKIASGTGTTMMHVSKTSMEERDI